MGGHRQPHSLTGAAGRGGEGADEPVHGVQADRSVRARRAPPLLHLVCDKGLLELGRLQNEPTSSNIVRTSSSASKFSF
jgi:hypothetical protein